MEQEIDLETNANRFQSVLDDTEKALTESSNRLRDLLGVELN